MQKRVLRNGLTILFERRKGNAVAIQMMIKTGSSHETPSEAGISHFLEHLLFEGTQRRPTNREISNEIEKIGGDFNAYTTNERTCFYIKVLKKHYPHAMDILADIFLNSLFKEEHVDKEKNIVLKEIDMVNDEASYYQWILLQKNLFKNHPCRNPTYGDRKVIQNLTREKIIAYFQKNYGGSNMVLSIVGDVAWQKELPPFSKIPRGKPIQLPKISERPLEKSQFTKEKRKIINTHAVLGFRGVPRSHPDSRVLEVINGILGRGQSGRMFTQIRSTHGLAYEVGTQHVSEASYGYFAVYATIDKKNIKLVENLIRQEIEKIKDSSDKDIHEAQDFIEGNYLLSLEEVQKTADQLLFWEQVKDAKAMNNFLKEIHRVTINDIRRVVDKYLVNYTLVVVQGK